MPPHEAMEIVTSEYRLCVAAHQGGRDAATRGDGERAPGVSLYLQARQARSGTSADDRRPCSVSARS